MKIEDEWIELWKKKQTLTRHGGVFLRQPASTAQLHLQHEPLTMPLPPSTPSPHRFVIKKERPFRSTPLAQSQTPRPSTQQFNATPRFTSRPPATRTSIASTQNVSRVTPSASRYLTPARPHTEIHSEVIEDEVDEDEILLDIHDSIETNGLEQETSSDYESVVDEDDGYGIEGPSPKRRRVSLSPEDELNLGGDIAIHDQESNLSSSLPTLSPPPAPRPSKAPRFIISTPAPQSASRATDGTQTFLKPPRFRPPDLASSQQTQSDPLPEHFSPHRRGQKYVPGGLAAEVRDWLVNLESALPSTSAQKKGTDTDPWLARVLVDEISGNGRDGLTLVRGRQILSMDEGKMFNTPGVVRVILAGEGQYVGLQKGALVSIGKTVGIKGPVWEVVLEGVQCGVGVDWKVLP